MKKILILASGSGSTFQYLVQSRLFQIKGLISDRKALSLKKAKEMGIFSQTVLRKNYSSYEKWDKALAEAARSFGKMDLIILAGFLSLLGPRFLSSYRGRVINSHPSLLPRFGGKGMYGIHVHRAVIKAQEKETGISIHYVDEKYDRGQVISQKKIKVLKKDTAETLEKRVKKEEKIFYASVIEGLKI